jgi:hypothetical protein
MDLAKGSIKRHQREQRSQSASLRSRLGTTAGFNTSASVYGLSFPGQATIGLSFPSQATIGLSFPSQATIGLSFPSQATIGLSFPSQATNGLSFPSQTTKGPLGFPYKATNRVIACSSEYRSRSRSKARFSDRG